VSFAFRLTEARQWHSAHGTARHPTTATPDVYAVTVNETGCRIAASAGMAKGIYVVVDTDDHVIYIGKVCRETPAAIRDRFATHHAAQPCWTAVWLLPLHDQISNSEVEALEANLIKVYRPVGNKQHNPRSWAA
jgi:hypothetical protein